ncbi:uncharacterized protein LOC125492601 [Beta vulgaris subsp. vulgaris]|uniref:uncharacterized protein LOC125492601 n=1 Tax=Beta vulgaris subsp. vulgaris TaxID=3555 RepID=UPI00203675A9|nr:uncharacterized protein LOC125492601 [Beta vulgaris subsp. vulgaris]
MAAKFQSENCTKFCGNYRSGIAWIGHIGNQRGTMPQSATYNSASSLQTEALAALRALSWACDEGYNHIKLCTASHTLVQALQSGGPPLISISWTVGSILNVANSFASCLVVHVPKAQVVEARALAYRCRDSTFRF